GDLLTLTARTLHGFSAAGYRDILHWEVRPGGWLPLHALRRAPSRATVGRLLASLELKEWANVRGARAFAARMRGPGDRQLEFLLRWKHRERRHSLSLDLYGSLTREHVHAVIAALGRHLPILRSEVTAVRHGGRRR
ncbi:MAG TPA: hypothetical protein VLY85_01275, partial [Thermoplasmata archaeon]|nr:hypothetical protein [Thermoplasmata archaeon]